MRRPNPGNLLPVLLEHGADVNAKTTSGETALQELAMSGSLDGLRLLLERGAEVNAATEAGETALHWAAFNGHVAAVELLLEYEADVNTRTIYGETALSWAAKQESSRYRTVVDMLLQYGALEASVDETSIPKDGRESPPGVTGARQEFCKKKWSILIGINTYPGNHDLHNLRGCVNDVSLAESYLRDTGVEESNIIKLVTDQEGGHGLPTVQNIHKELANISNRAASGDLVYIHYSGNAVVEPTRFPELKGSDGLDVFLVPMDAHCGGGYLREVEIAYHLNKMVEKGLLVTLALDCQSPFGVETAKGRSHEDALMKDSPVLFDTKMGRLAEGRKFVTGNGGELSLEDLLEPRGYTVLAAAPADGTVIECPTKSDEVHGVFTYLIFQKVLRAGVPLPLGTFQRRLHAAMKGRGNTDPVILGDNRGFFFEHQVA